MEQKWKDLWGESIRDVEGVKQFLNLTEEEGRQMGEIMERYPVCINSYYLSLINKDDVKDPIRKMCIPDIHEFSEGGQTDTSGETENTVFQGLQHKYRQTALILSTNQCAMYCRHCFRKRMVGSNSDEIARQLPAMADYIRSHKEINNVLISGGDSFMNSNEVIEKYLQYFTEIPTLDFIRFGTRIPVVLPQRITEDEELIRILKSYNERKQIIIVTQFNHPRELTKEALAAVKTLKDAGCIIRNQTVLLKGVNDAASVMKELMNKLVSYGVIPYYIFQCRPVEGVKNQFQIPFTKGIDIIEEAKKGMNGQAKSVRFVLSHPTGKIEIAGKLTDNEVIFKYHQAKYDKDQSRIFVKKIKEEQCWLDEEV
ncbi:KamA family radical SAM protein [Acetivibrio ethanolgignens]|uniref:Lysine 2,3-aminomutase n=1 Tax=Acetivibrio ethanolgignens TaxID=290052 RepID=A0A0V8QDQ1_9FIRM|nr:KamA family radical SAM protein [Acetivibrio ethanolgignens]KSV58531.1 lysine 2,3-aminomutase [Acetivibrio ethanolgignens]